MINNCILFNNEQIQQKVRIPEGKKSDNTSTCTTGIFDQNPGGHLFPICSPIFSERGCRDGDGWTPGAVQVLQG